MPAQEIASEKNQDCLSLLPGIALCAGAPIWIPRWLVYPPSHAGLAPAEAALLRVRVLTVELARLWSRN